ncbi:MAG: hypothetical protein AMJ77_01940 [Dehalococcoidia bacterium SM23_28_2]|nr:MAG: hypothetical protein AMJ77_01940 [Dehalococcoidia bacterium SM23_28_2]
MRSFWRQEFGQGLVLGTLAMIVVLSLCALVLDVGMFLHEKRELQKAVDAAALAAAQNLPESWPDAETDASEWLAKNGIDTSDGDSVDISFTCTSEYDIACDPAADRWDTIVVRAERNVPLNFAPLMGLDNITVSATAGGCQGLCGASPFVPVDVMMVLDRTGSMDDGDMANAKQGAKAILSVFDEDYQRVGLATIGPAKDTSDCQGEPYHCFLWWCNPPLPYPNLPDSRWVTTHLSDDFQNPDGSPDESSSLVSNISCLQTSQTGTDLGDPLWAAAEELQANGRPGEKWGIVFLSDGAANQAEDAQQGSCGSEPDSYDPCEYAIQKAQDAKDLGIEIYVIGYGVDDPMIGSRCECDRGAWEDAEARDVLQAMATDEYHYFEEPKGSDLTEVFEAIGLELSTGIRLVVTADG